jgi:hypothetical protein
LRFLSTASDGIAKLKESLKDSASAASDFLSFNEEDVGTLRNYVKEYEEKKSFLVGYLFNKQKAAEIDFRFKQALQTTHVTPHLQLTS